MDLGTKIEHVEFYNSPVDLIYIIPIGITEFSILDLLINYFILIVTETITFDHPIQYQVQLSPSLWLPGYLTWAIFFNISYPI